MQAPKWFSGEFVHDKRCDALVSDFSVSLSGGPTTQGNRMRPVKVFEI